MQTFHINAIFLLKYKLPQLFRSGETGPKFK